MDTKHKITTLFLTVECVQMGVYEGIVSPGELASALFFFGLTDRPAGDVPKLDFGTRHSDRLRRAYTRQVVLDALRVAAAEGRLAWRNPSRETDWTTLNTFLTANDLPIVHVHPPYPAPSIEPFSLRTAKTQIMMQALPICAISYI
jgi:hypothetical protein